MIWLTWRQFRFHATVTLTILAAATIYVMATGLRMHHAYAADIAACPHPQARLQVLPLLPEQLQRRAATAGNARARSTRTDRDLLGAPLIAAELERGSHRMLWNQSVTPTRWLTVKLAILALAALLTAGILSLLLTWWASPLDQRANDRFAAMTFATRGIAPLGYATFAFALGTVLGLLIRRTLPAMAVTLAVFIALQILFAAVLRPNLLPSTTATMPINATTMSQVQGIGTGPDPSGPVEIFGPGPAGAWILSATNLENSSGHEISGDQVSTCINSQSLDLTGLGSCLAPYNLHIDYTYQPAGNYWPLQWLETGIYLALAALLGGACFWRIRRHRD